jgi:hypothetical protein
MQIRNPLLNVRKQFGVMNGLLLNLLLIAVLNFAQIFYENYQAHSASGTHTYPDGMQITVCYFGPPVGFYPRFFVFILLLTAFVSSLMKKLRYRIFSFLGVAGALSSYIYWWIASYIAFKSFSSYEMDFMNSPEITQVAYLYRGNWWDIGLAVSLFVIFILQTEGLAARRFRIE